MRRLVSFALLLPLALLGGCSEEPSAPSAVVLSTMPPFVAPGFTGHDDVTIGLRYRDDDGDLGGGSAEITDCRDGRVTSKAIAAGSAATEGELDLVIEDVQYLHAEDLVDGACAAFGVTEGVSSDHITYCLVLVDAGRHRGPGVCTTVGFAPIQPA